MHNARGAISRGKFPEMAAAGVSLCLGADAAACNNSLDMFRSMYLAAMAHNETRLAFGHLPARARAGDGHARRRAGARVERRHRRPRAGQARRRHRGRPAPLEPEPCLRRHADPEPRLLRERSDVTFAMVDGRVLMRDRRITFLDEDALVARAQRCGERMLGRVPYRLTPRWPVSPRREDPRDDDC
jgi:cytosine/adenosine deaminase-related metal-dependent hydrolase